MPAISMTRFELDLAPATADVRSAQGGDEVSGLDPEAIMVASQQADVLGELAVGLLPDSLDALELAVHPFERVLERTHVARQA